MPPSMHESIKRRKKPLPDQTVTTGRHIFSYPLDVFLWLESKPLDTLVEQLAEEIGAVYVWRRKRDVKTQEKFLFSLKILFLNLAKLQRLPAQAWLGVPKAAGAFTAKNRYSHPLFSYRPFKESYDALHGLEYIEVSKNGWIDRATGKGEVTRIVAMPKLRKLLKKALPQETILFSRHPKEETLILRTEKKNGRKHLLDYEDADDTRSMRDRLRQINNRLSRHWYDLELSEDQFAKLSEEMAERHKVKPKTPPEIDFSARSVYRVFNNGTFEEGGRFYGAWWISLLSEYRQYITIDQKHTVEVDFSNLHPAMMYAKEGLPLIGDAYDIESIKRDFVKTAFAQLVNGRRKYRTPEDFKPDEQGMTWKDVLSTVESKHEPIKEYFRTGHGLKLQRLDSDIAERVILHFAEQGYPCLPIHDSFIVHHGLEDELKETMLAEYQKELGAEINLKTDDYFGLFTERVRSKRESGWEDTPIEELLLQEVSSQYQRRWTSWLDQKKHL